MCRPTHRRRLAAVVALALAAAGCGEDVAQHGPADLGDTAPNDAADLGDGDAGDGPDTSPPVVLDEQPRALVPGGEGWARGSQRLFGLTADATGYLALWGDYATSGLPRLVGGRLDASPGPARVAPLEGALAEGYSGRIASNGDGFLLVFSGADSAEVLAAPLTAEGALAGSVVSLATGAYGADVAWTGSSYLVVWLNGDSELRSSRVSAAGELLTPAAVRLASNATVPAVAGDGRGALVVWTDGGDVRAVRLDAAGTPLDPAGLLLAEDTGYPRPVAVSTGDGYVVAWAQWSDGRCDLVGTRLDESGTVIRRLAVAPMGSQSCVATVALTYNGDVALVAWHDHARLAIARVTGTGEVEAAGDVPWLASDDFGFPMPPVVALASVGSDSVMVWSGSQPASDGDVYALRLGPDGAPAEPTPRLLSVGPSIQLEPALARGDAATLMAWSDSRGGLAAGWDVLAALIDAEGTVGDVIPVAAGPEDARSPAVASDGSGFLVSWKDHLEEAVYAARIDGAGRLLDDPPVLLGPSAGPLDGYCDIAAAWNGGAWAVVWVGPADRLWGARLGADGRAHNPHILGGSPDEAVEAVALAAEGEDGFRVTWGGVTGRDFWDEVSTAWTVRTARLDARTELGEATALGRGRLPVLDTDGDGHLVVWEDEGLDPPGQGLFAVHLPTGGAEPGAPGVLLSDATASAPTLAGDAAGGLVLTWTAGAWDDRRLDVARIVEGALAEPVDLGGEASAYDWTVPGPRAAIAMRSATQALVVWEREDARGAHQLGGRLVELGPP